MKDLYYRRVWKWDGTQWLVAVEGPVRSLYGISCAPAFEGLSFCAAPPPQVFERWWRHSPSTWGGGSGSWAFEGERTNY